MIKDIIKSLPDLFLRVSFKTITVRTSMIIRNTKNSILNKLVCKITYLLVIVIILKFVCYSDKEPMTEVKFYDPSFEPGAALTYSVISANFRGQWIFVRHQDRSTWEIAGGHIEPGETSHDAASRELMEETGALRFNLNCVATYSVTKDGITGFGRLYLADVYELGQVPDLSEIAEVIFLDNLPENLTYPDIQPFLFMKSVEHLNARNKSQV